MPTGTAVVVPVKAFDRAKERLAGALDPAERAALAQRLATGVLGAVLRAPWPVLVVCDDEATAAWGAGLGAGVLVQMGQGLNAAADEARAHLRGRASRLAVVHADLAHPDGLVELLAEASTGDDVALVPDHRRDGTTVLVLPMGAPFAFGYGAGSFARHCDEAARLGLGPRVLDAASLGADVDVPEDLAGLDDAC